jgi:CubicO group peptidase (beta-lactamase class C family)
MPLLLGGISHLANLAAGQDRLPLVTPAEAGLNSQKLSEMEPLIETALAEKRMPGCVLCLGRQGKIFWLKAYGNKRVEPEPEPMTTDTLFDLASLTKPIATATSVMLLVERGKVKLDEPVATYLPAFAAEDKGKVTVRQLLIHTSGLIPDNPLRDYEAGAGEAWQRICALKLQTPSGERFAYSDVNFIVLGKLVESVSGQSLPEFTKSNIFGPLGMHETGYLPSETLRQRAAPTEKREGVWMQGEVHDPRAWKLGGVAGHAGLFSTATDLALYANALLQDAASEAEPKLFKQATLRQMIAPQPVPLWRKSGDPAEGWRGLGWDMRTGYSINRGENWSPAAFGHGGFTGTVLWIDPQANLFFIFLSNRLHPGGKGSVNKVAGAIAAQVMWALTAER